MTIQEILIQKVLTGSGVAGRRARGEISRELASHIEDIIEEARAAGHDGPDIDRILHPRDAITHQCLVAQLRDPERGDAAVAGMTSLLRQRHHILPAAQDDFTVTNPRAIIAQVTQVGTTLSRTLTGVAAVAMLVGGVVIMSLMLIAVAERRREIGVRRSFGATRRDILIQFMLEALAVSFAGGLSGVALALAGTNLVARLQNLPAIFAWNVLGLAVGISVAVGFCLGSIRRGKRRA